MKKENLSGVKMMSKLELWMSGWVDVATGLARIISFGYWNPDWQFSYCLYTLKRKYPNDNL